MTQIFKIKLIIIGQHACGKTSLIKNFVEGAYTKDYRPTIGANLFIKKMAFEDSKGEDYQFTITTWDIAGQERWSAMRHTYYRGANGVFLVGDLTRKQTFNQVESFWAPDFRERMPADVPMVLIANKNDLKPEISEEEVRTIADRMNLEKVIFTSAKTGYHVNEAFAALIKASSELSDLKPIPL
jgi:Ras-related protein Rab-1A